jgi:spermidine synthase
LAFGSGFAVLTIEIAGARLIAPIFGLSAVPWTAVIGVILTALAVGSYLGGRMADQGRIPLSAVLVAAALSGVIPLLGASVPWMARGALGFIGGSVASALILFAPAVLCLGAVVPYLVQADTDDLGNVGRRAGDVSAAATAGSIAGTFMTGFVLLPLFPLPILLGITAVGLLIMAGLSGWILGVRAPRPVLVLGALGIGVVATAASGVPADTLHQEQTLYASIKVTDRDWGEGRMVRELWQNGGSSSAEFVDTGDPAHDYAIVSGILLEPLGDRLDNVLVLGGAALSLPSALNRWRPDMQIQVVEIDPAVTRIAEEYFAYREADYPNIDVVHEDARLFLRSGESRFDVIYLDVFDHLLSVPWTMVTVEALEDLSARLDEGGVFMANILSPTRGSGARLLHRIKATAQEVFPEVRLYLMEEGADPTLTRNLILVAAHDAAAFPEIEWPQAEVPAVGRPLRDDWAPVEYLQARLFLEGIRWD